MKKGVIMFLCAILLFGTCMYAMGAAAKEDITAIINHELKIKLNGQDFTAVSSTGQVLKPITYNDSTYLPVRAIAEALSIAVDYDSKTQTVYLGERDKTPLETKHFEGLWSCQLTFDEGQLMINDEQYKSGILYTGKDGFYEMGGFVRPMGQFQKFGGVACMEDNDNTTEEVILKIREKDQGGKVLKEIQVKKGESIAFEIDISGIETIYIQNLIYDRVPKNTQPDKMAIADPYFK